jgi:Zn-dependent membrane protease YugP
MFIGGLYWWLVIPGIILAFYAQIKLASTFARYSRVATTSGLTGADAAREILDNGGLNGMPIREVSGHLTDHYDPMKKALFLSSENYHGRTLAAVGVAAHEAGHALQHKAAYAPLHLRMALVPVAGIATQAAFWLFMFGYFINVAKLAGIGIIIFGIITLFQLVTLPVEFDASSRAKDQLIRLGLIDGDERRGVSKVLSAAAMTYVAAMVQSFLQLLQFILIARGNDRD